MTDEPKVWISSRKLASGKPMYYLLWLDQDANRWRYRSVGTDKEKARDERRHLVRELTAGTHRDIRATSWVQFVDEVVGHLQGEHAEVARRTLTEFGAVAAVLTPAKVRPRTILFFTQQQKAKGLAVATVNKKLRYLRLAFNMAVDLDYIQATPMARIRLEKESRHIHRILGADEEVKVLAAAKKLYGFHMEACIRFMLETWGRRSEVLGLSWDDIDLEGESVVFRDTKSREDRFVPIDGSPVVGDLRRLRLDLGTAFAGGPFCWTKGRLKHRWGRVVKEAGIDPITVHDLRRTGITRALVGGMPPALAQQRAGHSEIATTMKFYVQVSRNDMRRAVRELRTVG